jgi:hypothetical protein
VRLREAKAGEALLEMFLDVLGHLLVTFLAPLSGHARSDLEGLLPSSGGEDGPEVCPKLLAACVAHHPEEVPCVVNLAALPRGPLQIGGRRLP